MRAFAIFALLAASSANAAPFLYADLADQGTTHCGYVIDGSPRIDVPVAGTPKVCKVDLAGTLPGNHTASLTAVKVDPLWGRMESAPSAPLAFSVPATPAVPGDLRLAP